MQGEQRLVEFVRELGRGVLVERMGIEIVEVEPGRVVGTMPVEATRAAGPEDPQEVHLVATVDLEDPDEVLDVVMERMLQFQLDEGLPIYVSPRRTPQRRAALWAAQRQRTPLLPSSGSL